MESRILTSEITIEDDILFCNCKWEEANGLLAESWTAYMELGKVLRTLKEGKYKGQFKAWVNDNLKFSYEWARILMNAYTRYELSGFNDKPAASIKEYAKDNPSCPKSDIDKLAEAGELTLADLLKPAPLPKREQMAQDWMVNNPGPYDECDKFLLMRTLPMLKAAVKKFGPIAISQLEVLASMIKSDRL